jgi:hypothetical protein
MRFSLNITGCVVWSINAITAAISWKTWEPSWVVTFMILVACWHLVFALLEARR